jgi:FkbM family methyltransferase
MISTFRLLASLPRNIKYIGLASSLKHLIWSLLRRKRVLKVAICHRHVFIRTNTHDLDVALSTLVDELDPVSRVLPATYDGLIVDAGSYIGTAAIRLAELFPNAHIVALEPSTENYTIAQKNVSAYRSIILLKAALVPHANGMALLRNRLTGEWGYTIVETPLDRSDASPIEECETITLKGITSRFGGDIGLLKLDIEGGEEALFRESLDQVGQIHAVFVELHDRIARGCTDAFMRFSENRHVYSFGSEKFLSVREVIRQF